MGALWRHLLPLLGACYVGTGVALGLRAAGLDIGGLLAAAAALGVGLTAAAAAQHLDLPVQRRPLLAASLLAPVALLSPPYQPAPEAVAPLRELMLALGVHVLWALSRHPVESRVRGVEWGGLVLMYVGSLAVASGQLAGEQPEVFSTSPLHVSWLIVVLGAVVVMQTYRVQAPKSLSQESSAHELLWTATTTAAASAAVYWLAPCSVRTSLTWSVGGLATSWGVLRTAARIRTRDLSFTWRDPLSLVGAVVVAGAIPWLLGDPGPWPLPSLAAAALLIAMASPLLQRLLRQALDIVPRSSDVLLERAVARVELDMRTAEDLGELGAALLPLAQALARGSVGLICFDPDRTVHLRDGDVVVGHDSSAQALRELLAPPDGPRSITASSVSDRSVRATDLRPVAAFIQEIGADLVVPLPGGPDGALAGALLVGRPARGRGAFLRARRAAHLETLAEQLGPRLRAAALLDAAAARVGALERDLAGLEDRIERLTYQNERANAENSLLRSDQAGTAPREIVGRSPAMKELLATIESSARIGTHVTILGEAGTGRSLVARAIHEAGDRRRGPLVRFDCAGHDSAAHVPALLGEETGDGARPGLIELADRGTLVLEEVGALSLDAQSEVIRVLASGDVSRLHGAALRRVDVLVIGTTGRSSELVQEREAFLPELRSRIGAIEVRVPSLKDRRGDIAELARFFLERTVRRHGLAVERLAPEAVELFERYTWPGNVRQLRAVVEHAVLCATGRHVGIEDLPPLGGLVTLPRPPDAEGAALLEGTFEEIERRALAHTLRRADGNKAEAARLLGVKRTTLNSRLRKLGLG
jgi:DNA-binding NtrC family response regulator